MLSYSFFIEQFLDVQDLTLKQLCINLDLSIAED